MCEETCVTRRERVMRKGRERVTREGGKGNGRRGTESIMRKAIK